MTATKSYMAKGEEISPCWFVVDADTQVVGRLASKIAMVLMGKHKATYTPHVDCGDVVVVVNVEKVRFSGTPLAHSQNPNFTTKMLKKTYEHYTGYPSGRRIQAAAEVFARRPELILSEAVRRMMPKNKLGRKMFRKLKLYCGSEHPHQAQSPQPLPAHLLP